MYGHRKESVHYEEILLWSRSITVYNTKMVRIDASRSVKAVIRNGESSSPSIRAYRKGVFGFCESRYYIRRQNESDTGQT